METEGGEPVYQALYRKYRPRTFDEVVGQRSITQTLKTQVASGKLSHAYLFTGTRGTGKTSCAKILARAVNCEHPVDGNPCNRCAACRSIEAGACMDVLEIDAASNNGVDHVRALRDDAIYTPGEVKKRVYIIDEVHMLSMSAFNALLKIIEEPPAHLMFILATTELQKVPATILSRCQRFSFRRLLPEDIRERISYVSYQEGIELLPEAAGILARLADGALRDGLSLLDQCASSADGPVTASFVYDCLGLAGERATYEMLLAVAAQDASHALSLFARLYGEGKDMGAMLDELCAVARDLLILKTAPESGLAMISGLCTGKEAAALAAKFSPGELLRMVSLLQETMAGSAKTANLRIDAELCLMKLCSPALRMDAEALGARLSRLEEQVASGALPARSARPADGDAPFPEDGDDIASERAPFPEDGDDPASERAPLPEDGDDLAPEEAPACAADGVPAGFWPDLVTALRAEFGPPVKGFFAAQGPIKPSLTGDTLCLRADSEFVKNMISSPEVLLAVAKRASALLGRPVRATAAVAGRQDPGGRDRMDDLIALRGKLGDQLTIK
ncbi:MAG: DNA polymerase III subunit gamma/tau [Oscillospiraceae bacterium]|nr:DNA polymerase III subunit gamma/tau [Oscillospiraceae bacterium]